MSETVISMNNVEIYYAVVNILDYIAKNKNISIMETTKLFCILDELIKISGDEIVDIADANDAGGCITWMEIVERFRDLYKKGERI